MQRFKVKGIAWWWWMCLVPAEVGKVRCSEPGVQSEFPGQPGLHGNHWNQKNGCHAQHNQEKFYTYLSLSNCCSPAFSQGSHRSWNETTTPTGLSQVRGLNHHKSAHIVCLHLWRWKFSYVVPRALSVQVYQQALADLFIVHSVWIYATLF